MHSGKSRLDVIPVIFLQTPMDHPNNMHGFSKELRAMCITSYAKQISSCSTGHPP